MSEETSSFLASSPAIVYQIRVEGRLDPHWSDWFNGLMITLDSEDPPITTLIGAIIDQASLRGILMRIWNLNLSLVSVNRLDNGAHLAAGAPVTDAVVRS